MVRQLIIVFIMLLIFNRLIFHGRPTYVSVSLIPSNLQLNPILLRLLCQHVLNGLGGVHLLFYVLNNDMKY